MEVRFCPSESSDEKTDCEWRNGRISCSRQCINHRGYKRMCVCVCVRVSVCVCVSRNIDMGERLLNKVVAFGRKYPHASASTAPNSAEGTDISAAGSVFV